MVKSISFTPSFPWSHRLAMDQTGPSVVFFYANTHFTVYHKTESANILFFHILWVRDDFPCPVCQIFVGVIGEIRNKEWKGLKSWLVDKLKRWWIVFSLINLSNQSTFHIIFLKHGYKRADKQGCVISNRFYNAISAGISFVLANPAFAWHGRYFENNMPTIK